MKLNDEQLASLTNPKTVAEYIEHEKENIVQVIKQNLAVGDIFKRENLQVKILYSCSGVYIHLTAFFYCSL